MSDRLKGPLPILAMAGLIFSVLMILIAAPSASAKFGLVTKWGGKGSGNRQFKRPVAVTTDLAGDVYVISAGNSRIQKFTSNGGFITKWGTRGSGDGQFDHPLGVATDIAGNVYVADAGNHRIQKFSSDGTFVSKWGTPGTGNGQFDFPVDISADAFGNVYVFDYGNERVQKFNAAGAFVLKWGGAGSGDGQFDHPESLASDLAGNVYVADKFNFRIQKFTADGVFVTKWGVRGSRKGQFQRPVGVAVGISGNVYVADAGADRIQKFTADGAFIARWGRSGSRRSQFRKPVDVATDVANNVFVADAGNNRIQKFGIVKPGPGVTITKGPKGSAGAKVRFRFRTKVSGAGFQCRLTGRAVGRTLGRWRSCKSPKSYTGLIPGKKTFMVRAVKAGKRGKPAKHRFRVSAKAKPTRLSPRRIKFRGGHGKLTLRCRLKHKCRGTITVVKRNRTLVKLRKYSIAARSRKKLKLTLTKVGLKALGKRGRVRGTAILVGKSTGRSSIFTAYLRR